MSLTLDPEIETQVRREAARRGVSPQDFLRGTLNSVRVHSPELAPRPLGTSGHLSGCPVPFELRLSGRSLPRDTPELAPASVIFALSPDPGPAAFSTTELQVRICEGFTEAFWQTYRSLLQKRAAETLTPEEQQQLIALSDEIEERDGQRLVYLAELARRRSVPVRTLMQQLGLRPATVA